MRLAEAGSVRSGTSFEYAHLWVHCWRRLEGRGDLYEACYVSDLRPYLVITNSRRRSMRQAGSQAWDASPFLCVNVSCLREGWCIEECIAAKCHCKALVCSRSKNAAALAFRFDDETASCTSEREISGVPSKIYLKTKILLDDTK